MKLRAAIATRSDWCANEHGVLADGWRRLRFSNLLVFFLRAVSLLVAVDLHASICIWLRGSSFGAGLFFLDARNVRANEFGPPRGMWKERTRVPSAIDLRLTGDLRRVDGRIHRFGSLRRRQCGQFPEALSSA